MLIFCSRPHFFPEKLFGGKFVFLAGKYLDEIRQNSKELGKKSRFQESYPSGKFLENMILGGFWGHIWQRWFLDAKILFFDFLHRTPLANTFYHLPSPGCFYNGLSCSKMMFWAIFRWFYSHFGHLSCIMSTNLHYKKCVFTVFGKNRPFFPGVQF